MLPCLGDFSVDMQSSLAHGIFYYSRHAVAMCSVHRVQSGPVLARGLFDWHPCLKCFRQLNLLVILEDISLLHQEASLVLHCRPIGVWAIICGYVDVVGNFFLLHLLKSWNSLQLSVVLFTRAVTVFTSESLFIFIMLLTIMSDVPKAVFISTLHIYSLVLLNSE